MKSSTSKGKGLDDPGEPITKILFSTGLSCYRERRRWHCFSLLGRGQVGHSGIEMPLLQHKTSKRTYDALIVLWSTIAKRKKEAMFNC